MCLAVPGRIKSLSGTSAIVDFGGIERSVHTVLVPGVAEGDYVLVHAGFAIQVIDEEAAEETIELLKTMEIYDADEAGV